MIIETKDKFQDQSQVKTVTLECTIVLSVSQANVFVFFSCNSSYALKHLDMLSVLSNEVIAN